MKINRTISIDIEIYERLKEEDNYSDLINRLLNDYYKTGGSKSKKELLEATESLSKEINDKEAQFLSLQTELNTMKAEELKNKNKKPICPNCNSESTIVWKGNLVCMKCRYEEPYNDN